MTFWSSGDGMVRIVNKMLTLNLIRRKAEQERIAVVKKLVNEKKSNS